MSNKAVLLSAKPKWCALIASGKKTLEVRKNKPKIETPFKVYIYCTNDRKNHFWTGKVIGEFTCDRIIDVDCDSIAPFDKSTGIYVDKQCQLSREELWKYTGGYCAHGWHISNLVIYDEPKPLERFRKMCKYRSDDSSCQWRKVECECVKFDFNPDGSVNFAECCDYMSRPPQPWCYVEEANK